MDRNILIIRQHSAPNSVALRKESVDRNNSLESKQIDPSVSLSARRAWIEIDAIAVQAANSSGRSPQGERG